MMLVPDNRLERAWNIRNSGFVPGIENQKNMFGPEGLIRPTIKTSPKLDDIDTTAWYLGDFPRQFRLKTKLALEAVSVMQDPREFLISRIAFEARVAWDHEVGAIDYNRVVQNLEGTVYNPQ